jgi:hypothetical protein
VDVGDAHAGVVVGGTPLLMGIEEGFDFGKLFPEVGRRAGDFQIALNLEGGEAHPVNEGLMDLKLNGRDGLVLTPGP